MYNFEHMRIAFFTDMFLPQANGIATSLGNLARALGEKGHQVLIFTPKLDHIPREKFQAKNVTVVSLRSIPSLIYTELNLVVFGLPKAMKYLKEFNPDIIHLQSTMTIGIDAVMAAKLLKKPLVGTIHIYFTNSDYLHFVKYRLAVKLLGKIAFNYVNFLYKRCVLLFAPSKTLIEELKNNGFKKQVHYLPNGLYLKEPRFLNDKEKAKIKRKYGLKERVVLHFGRLSYEKGVDILIKSFHKLIANHKDVSLLLIGDGPARKNLVRLVKKLGIEQNVVFTGFIEHHFLLSSGLLSLGDVFATASRMEVNPMAVLEAMLYGLPVVGVKQAGLIELVTSNGFLVKPGSAPDLTEKIEEVLYDKELAAKMRGQSLKVVKEYSIDRVASRLLRSYRNLISKTAR